MEQVYDVLESFVDPVFIIFILLLISFFNLPDQRRRKAALCFYC